MTQQELDTSTRIRRLDEVIRTYHGGAILTSSDLEQRLIRLDERGLNGTVSSNDGILERARHVEQVVWERPIEERRRLHQDPDVHTAVVFALLSPHEQGKVLQGKEIQVDTRGNTLERQTRVNTQ